MSNFEEIFTEANKFVNNAHFLTSDVSTNAIHTGHVAFDHCGTGCPVIPPIALSTTFAQKSPNEPLKYDYSRAGNYCRELLEKSIAAMENAKYCCSFSSGLATLSSVTNLFSPGDHVLFFNDVYGGTSRYFDKVAGKFKICCEPIDMQDLELFRSSLKENTKMIWIETPSNPLMRIVDIKSIVDITKTYNKNIIVVVDNTFLTPVFQKPLSLGADMVMHSLTKYMNGHSDVLMGAVAMDNEEIFNNLQQQQLMIGAVPSPFDCYLALRGMRTLVVRMRQHQFSGLVVALFLSKHSKVEKVLHPAFLPDQEIIKKQMFGFSGMLSVYIKGGKDDAIKFIQSLKYFQLAESLGGFESLVEIPSLMTHASIPAERREMLGIKDNMVRISVGLEDITSLLLDLQDALSKI